MGGGMHETNWLPPLLVLGLGLLAGLVLAVKFARSKRGAAAAMPHAVAIEDVEVRDLRVQRDLLVAQLRELDDTAGKRTADELARDRFALELQAAAVLRDLDLAEARERKAEAAAAAAPAAAAAKPTPAWVGAAWGGGVVLFGALLFFILQSESGNRAPGGSITGNGPTVNGPAGNGQMAEGQQAPAQPDPELEQFIARAQANPQDLEAQLDLAQAFLYRERLVEVFQVVQHIKTLDAENPRALTYEAVVRQAMGMAEQALALLDTAVRKDPQLAEAWVRRGLVAFDVAKYDVAVESWEKALAIRPDGKEALAPVIAEAKLRMENKGKVAPVPSPEELAAAPVKAPAPAPEPAAGPNDLQVVLELDPALAGKVAPGTPIFVSVRSAGVKMGPPAAAKRLAAGSFPLTLVIGPGDTMMGQPLPNPAYVEARIDGDGNAMTRDPSDPSANADGVAAGKATTLVLRAGN
ncbi:tetratricopeptide repeat protein [Vulgatibacter sp.]|uniref:tetratricopeptide repeat protein n=1 Tax=Vulgatibacter sp. TaxID=1971226 RepID=UPI003563B086